MRSNVLLLGLVLLGSASAWSAEPSPTTLDAQVIKAAFNDEDGVPLREVVFRKPDAGFEKFGGPGEYFPERAERNGVSGAVVLQCSVAASGQLSDCAVRAETPQAFDFAATSLKMAKSGFLTAKPVDGATGGEAGRILVVFKCPRG